ncbi:hypothetical protein FHS18_001378 [Paenibacillus phyllosphaerae]|uniref:Uncharacterized protein n=1 Tax=Paenibacillus phyllosphaerae TaxID=274593 RepID=A0A7W5AWB7_9BACL|nr:hypothetical protein [Paenibacillus phyllosphaerae]MBB3109326.1 hypothetical protein [Paenibacillus phyllosphaerae]
MNIRIMPTVVTAVISAGLLVGGWFAYQNVATVQPLEQILVDVPGVTEAVPNVQRDAVTVSLKLDNDANIRDVYDTILLEGEHVIGDRELRLQIDNSKSDEILNDIWSSVLFNIAQAMETRQYTGIPTAMEQIESKYEGVTATSEMDDMNVYITLKHGAAAKYVILPRTPEQMGVWPNA